MSAPLVSIIINNFNYGRFLSAAIESALHQTYSPIEVLVVDDGSTDNSREIIASYGDRIVPVLKENGGQASTFNAGFVKSHGELIIFLDADDILTPHIVERVVPIFQRNPAIAKVQYRMAVINAQGIPTGALKPQRHLPMRSGDLRQQVVTCFDETTWQSTSGNVFAAQILRQIFPVPEEVYPRTGADYYVSNLPLLFGPIVSLDDVGAYFRIHGANNHHTSKMNLDRTREIIRRIGKTHEYIQARAGPLGLKRHSGDASNVLGVRFLAHRLTSLKLDPPHHPIKDDTLLQLLLRGIMASFRRSDLPLSARTIYAVWFLAMVLAPAGLARWLAERHFYPDTRGNFPWNSKHPTSTARKHPAGTRDQPESDTTDLARSSGDEADSIAQRERAIQDASFARLGHDEHAT